MGGQVGVKILYLAGTVAATRAVVPTGWGLLSAVILAGFIAITGVNLALNPYLSRELAAGVLPVARLVSSAGRFRLASSLLFALTHP